MPKFQGVIGTQVAVTGATSIRIDDRLFRNISNRAILDYAVFAISVTQVGTQNFNVHIVGDIAGVTLPIAGLSGIGTTTSTLVPIINERIIGTVLGTTQLNQMITGVPIPRRIVFGNSATPGQTYSAVVSAILQAID